MDRGLQWDEEGWKCRKHPSQPRYGVCPGCLRERLLLLCPECASVRPCGCLPSSSSSSSSLSSLSSSDLLRSGDGGGIGAVGRVSNLIDSEPAFRRSKSAAFQFLRARSERMPASSAPAIGETPRVESGRKWVAIWPFYKSAARKEESKERKTFADAEFSRSRSVGLAMFSDSGRGDGRAKGWSWHFPSPMKVFRQRKSSKVVQDQRPVMVRV